MDTPIVKMMILTASVAIAIVMVALGYSILGNTVPEERSEVDLSLVSYDVLCQSLGGQWISGSCVSSGSPPPTFTPTTSGGTTTTSRTSVTVPTAPGSPRSLVGTPLRNYGVRWAWDAAVNNGGRPVTAFDLQWRVAGNAWSGNTVRVVSYFHELRGFSSGQGVDVRVRAVNSVGAGGWITPHETVDASDMLGTSFLPQFIRFDTSTTFTWPWPDVSRAVIVLVGGDGGGGGRTATGRVSGRANWGTAGATGNAGADGYAILYPQPVG